MGLERGLELIRAGEYFEAHEELEDEWRDAPAAERDFLQGLVHVAVAWLHAERGNRPGCERQLEKAARRLGAVPAVASRRRRRRRARRRRAARDSRRVRLAVAPAPAGLSSSYKSYLGSAFAASGAAQKAGSSPSHSRKRFR